MSLLTDLAGYLAPLLNPERPGLDLVGFVGSKTDLQAFASDGHVAAVVTVVGDFSQVGEVALPGVIARRIGYRDHCFNPWDDPEQDKGLEAEPHLRPAEEKGELRLRHVLKEMPKSHAPRPAMARFLGPAIATLGAVTARLGVTVQFGGGPDLRKGMRVDSRACHWKDDHDELRLLWVSFAIMPGEDVS